MVRSSQSPHDRPQSIWTSSKGTRSTHPLSVRISMPKSGIASEALILTNCVPFPTAVTRYSARPETTCVPLLTAAPSGASALRATAKAPPSVWIHSH